jgi:hypothetical protein
VIHLIKLSSLKNAIKTGDSVYVRDLIKQMNQILREYKELIDN